MPVFFQIDLEEDHVITSVMTQGRYASGQGQEYAQAYRIMYWRQGMNTFKEYRDSIGNTVS